MDNFVELKGKKYLLKDTFYSVEVQFVLIESGIAGIGKRIEIFLNECRKEPEFEKLTTTQLIHILYLHNPVYRKILDELNTILYNPKNKILNTIFSLVYEDCKTTDFYDGTFDLLEDLPVLWDFFLNVISQRTITQPNSSENSRKPIPQKAKTIHKH